MDLEDLDCLGKRICILGPSCSGKSTLCVALADKLGVAGYHLDQIAHIPNSDYRFRPTLEWVADHDRIIESSSWIVDGNYSVCMRKRFERATAIIQLDPSRLAAVYRFIKRSIESNPDRPGALEGATAEFSWRRVRFTVFDYPRVKKEHDRLIEEITHLTVIRIGSMKTLNSYYKRWNLRPNR